MYISNYKVKLKKDTSYKGLWIVSFTLNVYTHMGLDDAEKELQEMQGLEKARKEMGISDKDDKPLKQNMFKVV